MNVFKLQLLLFLNILYVADSERRIQGGYPVLSQKTYMVYLVKAPKSKKKFDQWICGGALVTTSFILTAKSCVNDVEYMYAIAGYNVSVPYDEIDDDVCTRKMKKKVVYFYFPGGSDFSINKVSSWVATDIALAKVESEFKPVPLYDIFCSYKPTAIPVNYELRFQNPGTDAIILGWGHTDDWRMPFDKTNYNQKLLRYARIKLAENKLCKDHYKELAVEIDKYNMVCSIDEGDLDESGKVDIKSPQPKQNGCKEGLRTDNCTENLENLEEGDNDEDIIISLLDLKETLRNSTDKTSMISSYGFCQNDHGGPLVTWVGSKEVIIGIATLFKVSNKSKCTGPYLYTSTACHAPFLQCVLQSPENRPGICNSYKIIERYLSWTSHPAGPAENEVVKLSTVIHAGDTPNIQTNTTKAPNTFEELIKLETFWQQYNSSINKSATVARKI